MVYSLILGLYYRELTWTKILEGLKETAISTAGIMLIVGAASCFSWVMTKEQLTQLLATVMVDLISNKYLFLLLTNILLLILYIFLAIPVGIVGLAVLAVPTVLFLALASVCGYVGVSAIGLCFGAFAVIADTLAVFGAGLALLAAALLFVWLFVWFLGGAMVGFIRGLCRLGAKLCCKEVAVK